MFSELQKNAAAEREQAAEWAERMQLDLQSVRERARQLMADRDAEVAALKARLRAAGVSFPDSASSLPADSPLAVPPSPAGRVHDIVPRKLNLDGEVRCSALATIQPNK